MSKPFCHEAMYVYQKQLSSVFELNLHCKKKHAGLFNWACMVNLLQSEKMHSRILFCAALPTKFGDVYYHDSYIWMHLPVTFKCLPNSLVHI